MIRLALAFLRIVRQVLDARSIQFQYCGTIGPRYERKKKMNICVPMREMKDTARFSSIVEEAKEPVCVTKNGHDHLVVMTVNAYRAFEDQIAEAKLLSIISQADTDIANGHTVDGITAIEKIREKYGY
jgi:PHD/YefM family antitoxin component YafN of YafNO toxin-antitoxin module